MKHFFFDDRIISFFRKKQFMIRTGCCLKLTVVWHMVLPKYLFNDNGNSQKRQQFY